jgi:membrane-associated protein
LEHIIHLLEEFKYLILFPLAIVEGPILAVIAGLLCIEGFLNPWLVYPIIVLGDITGDSLLYALGRWSHSSHSEEPGRWRRLIGLSAAKLDRARAYFDQNPVKTVSLSKVILGVGVAGIFLAGNARVRYRTFIGVCLLVSAAQYIVYLSIGLLFGRAYKEISIYFNFAATIPIVLASAFFLVFIIKSLYKRR